MTEEYGRSPGRGALPECDHVWVYDNSSVEIATLNGVPIVASNLKVTEKCINCGALVIDQ